MPSPPRGHQSLRRGRLSAPGCHYFVTVCLERGSTGLNSSVVFDRAVEIFAEMKAEGLAELHGLVIMPDHLHTVIELQRSATLPLVIRLIKGRLSPLIRSLGLRWQKGSYFDHRLRPSDSMAAVLRYMQMNPYRKELAALTEVWPCWYCSPQARFWMNDTTDLPAPEWLAN